MFKTPASQLQTEEEKKLNEDMDDQQKKKVDEINVKLDFYGNVFGAISNVILNELSVQKVEYMIEIIQFFRTIISKFFARDPTCPELALIVANLFDWQRNFHQKVLNGYAMPQEVAKHDYEGSDMAKRIQSEMAWRMNELKVGDQVDVVKQ